MANGSARAVPILPVEDIGRAIDFYKRLGFAARRYRDGDGYAFLDRNDFEIHLSKSELLTSGQSPCGIYFYLAPRTAATFEAEFRAAGVRILSSLAVREWRMNEFVLDDPDGNLLRFGEPLG